MIKVESLKLRVKSLIAILFFIFVFGFAPKALAAAVDVTVYYSDGSTIATDVTLTDQISNSTVGQATSDDSNVAHIENVDLDPTHPYNIAGAAPGFSGSISYTPSGSDRDEVTLPMSGSGSGSSSGSGSNCGFPCWPHDYTGSDGVTLFEQDCKAAPNNGSFENNEGVTRCFFPNGSIWDLGEDGRPFSVITGGSGSNIGSSGSSGSGNAGIGTGTTSSSSTRSGGPSINSTAGATGSASNPFAGLTLSGGPISSNNGLSGFIQNNPQVRTVWRAILTLTNIIVVLILLGVAFATIFHIQVDTYGIKKVLPTLVVGVILANFSLLICRNIIDFASVLSATFINDKVGGSAGLIDNLSKGIVGGSFAQVSQALGANNTNSLVGTVAVGGLVIGAFAGFGWLILIGILLLGALMLILPALAFAILAFLLYARTVFLVFLTATAPAAFIAMAFAPTQGLFKQWWTQFLRWVFMAPIVFFFLWLATKFSFIGGTTSPSFPSYVISLAMIYLAIQVPFKLGGAVMGVYGGVGKKIFSTATKGAWSATNAGLDKVGSWRVGDKTIREKYGIMGFSSLATGVQEELKRGVEKNKALAVGEAEARTAGIVGGGVLRFGRGQKGQEIYNARKSLNQQKVEADFAKQRGYIGPDGNSTITSTDQLEKILTSEGPLAFKAALMAAMRDPKSRSVVSRDLSRVLNSLKTKDPNGLYKDAQRIISPYDPILGGNKDTLNYRLSSQTGRTLAGDAQLFRKLNEVGAEDHAAEFADNPALDAVAKFFKDERRMSTDMIAALSDASHATPETLAFLEKAKKGELGKQFEEFQNRVQTHFGSSGSTTPPPPPPPTPPSTNPPSTSARVPGPPTP